MHAGHGPEAARALEAEAALPPTGWEREIARGLELGLPGADSIVDRNVPTFSRGEMQELLLDVRRTTGTTILLVTHDVEEAVFLSQRVYVLSSHPGRVVEEVEVPFPADRDRLVVREPRFHAIVDDLGDVLRRNRAISSPVLVV